MVSRPDGIAVVQGTKHPASAMLFVDYTLTKGQQVFADAFLTPARKDLDLPASVTQTSEDVPDYIAHADEWDKKYDELTHLGKEGPSS